MEKQSPAIGELLAMVSKERAVSLAMELIRRPSDAETGAFILDFLRRAGIRAERQDCGEGRFNVGAGRRPEGASLYRAYRRGPGGGSFRLAFPALFPPPGGRQALRPRRRRHEGGAGGYAPRGGAASPSPRARAGGDDAL